MENITLEQIDLIMQRANVTYAEAKEALEHANGDSVEALLYLEAQQKIKPVKGECTAKDNVSSFINKLNATSFIMEKGEKKYLEVPLSVAIIFAIFAFYISAIVGIVALVKGVKFRIVGENSIVKKINETVNGIVK